METVIVKKGGYGYNLRFTIMDSDTGLPKNITTYTGFAFQVWDEYTPGTVKWSLVGTIVDGPSGWADFAVTASDFTETGVYLGEIELTKAGVVEPGDTFQVVVEESP